MEASAGPLDEATTQQIIGLFRAQQVFTAVINDSLKATGIDTQDLIILGMLKHSQGYQMPIGDITARNCVAKSVTSHRVRGLAKLGLVVRSGNPNDKRKVVIVLTAKGQRVYEVAHGIALNAVSKRIGKHLTAADFDYFGQLGKTASVINDDMNARRKTAT